MTRREIRLAGFGGQGLILSGYILGKASAIFDKKNAALMQSYGPEARGGACSAEVVISDEEIDYPHVTSPEILVAMSQEAYNVYAPKVANGAKIIIDKDLVDPSKVSKMPEKITLFSVPASRLAEELNKKIVANIVILGYLVTKTDVVTEQALIESIKDSVPKHTLELNLKAFQQGLEYGRKEK